MALDSSIVSVGKVTETDKEQMFALHSRYFQNSIRSRFISDFNEKDWVIVLRSNGLIAGFSTLKVMVMNLKGVKTVFLFSGDTIVDRAHWQDSTLAGCFGHVMLRLIRDYPDNPRYWFLISKGYRTYRFLPVYFKVFYPVYDRPTPPEYAELLRTVAGARFGSAFSQSTGLVSFAGEKDRLAPEVSRVDEFRLNDPHVAFFLERNPEFRRGDELACLADISRDNLNRFAWRAIEHTSVSWYE